MHIDLTGRRALVTGSSAGIGLAVVASLARCGATVLVNGRDADRVRTAVRTLAAAQPDARLEPVVADVADPAGARALTEAVGEADILVSNAATYQARAFADLTDDDWATMFAVNVIAPARLARLLVPGMVDRGWGRVVFISSESALHVPAEMIHYGASKTALLALSRGIAETYPASGVTVNAVLPGPTSTGAEETFIADLAAQRGTTPEEARRRFIQEDRPTSLLGRFIEPEEVAAAVTYLCSRAASATTGSAMRVDGGVVRAIG
ncbi:SDR family oxidoreductase [Streptomyces sp. AgN23]|uniref:SDR family NAD(P)-dependent oxidoreductase n=1 Tax=Streptomyces sp. AgN23 TaxID=1188315 RepID=UPI001B33A6D6|nr:SDR family oxidoreductase [Streptomyces sp. AgN23]QTI87267.1 SDR family oxidoreductase [Streptomyces sp. AgN23]